MMARSNVQARSLFETERIDAPSPSRKTGPAGIAQGFVRWCCSFGKDFRNSPDAGNLRAWAEREAVQYHLAQEARILKAARELYGKRVASSLRKATEKTA